MALHIQQRGLGSGGVQALDLANLGKNIQLSLGIGSKYRKFQRMYRDDRVAFAYDCVPALRDSLAHYQEEVLGLFDLGHRRVAVRAPHGSGKSTLAALLAHHAMLTTEEDALVPTLASVWRQLEEYLWPEIHKIAKLLDWYIIGRDPYGRDELMTTSMRMNDGISKAFAVSTGDAALIEGAHASRIFYVFDEAKTIPTPMWDAAEGAFSTEGTKILGRDSEGECFWFAISTPGPPSGRFYDIHMAKEGYEDWVRIHVTIDDAIKAGRVSGEWVEMRAKQWGVHKAVYKNRVLAEFATDSEEGVIPSSWIEDAFERYREWESKGAYGRGLGDRIIGVDTARLGSDKTVFAEQVNNRLEMLHEYSHLEVPVTAGYLKPLAESASEVRIEMDSGLGAGVYDILMQSQDAYNGTMRLVPVTMGAGYGGMDSTDTFAFLNVRAASWWNMRELLDPNGPHAESIMLRPDDELLGDLSEPKYEIKYRQNNLTIIVEPKENIKKADRLGRSPDKGDAVVLAFWDENSGGGAQGLVV